MKQEYDSNYDRAPKKMIGPPFCSCCGKFGDDVEPMQMDPSMKEKVYWFIFEDLNKETIENSQSIDSILDFASAEFEDSEEAPDAKNYSEQQGQRMMKIKFAVDTRKDFSLNYGVNLLCPNCAQEFIKDKTSPPKQEDSEGGWDDGFNPEAGGEERSW